MIRGPLSGSGWLIAAAVLMAQCAGGDASCEQQSTPRLAPAQPNRTSELAESMRMLDAELLGVKTLVENRDPALQEAQFTDIDFTQLAPTDSSMLVEGFTAFSKAFAHHVAAFNAAPSAETYSAVVGGCEACHMKACPGPLERIAKRHLAD